MTRHRFPGSPFFLLALLLFVAPVSAGLFDLSESRERKIGKEIMEKLKENYAYYADWEISGIGNLLRQATDSPEWVADFHVLPDPQVNAFALPGGHIMITEGLLEVLQTQDEVAFVLAHEAGHAIKRHIASEYKRANENNLLFSILLAAVGANRTWWDVGDFVQSVTRNQYSQKKEREADLVGFQLTAKAGFNPDAAASALDKLRQGHNDPSKTLNKLFGTHPLISERVHRLDLALDQEAPERPVLEPPLDSLAQTRLTFEYLNHDDAPWEDEWTLAIANRLNGSLADLGGVTLVRKWQLRRPLDQPDYRVVVHRRLVQKGKYTDATLEVDILDALTEERLWTKYYAPCTTSDRDARVAYFADAVADDVRTFCRQ